MIFSYKGDTHEVDFTEESIYTAEQMLKVNGITDAEAFLKDSMISSAYIDEARGQAGDSGIKVLAWQVDCITQRLHSEARAKYDGLIKPAEQYEEREAEWLIPKWIPKGVVSAVYGDGGSGKSYFTLDLISKLTRGQATILDTDQETHRNPLTVLYCNHEDSIEVVTKGRLRKSGADMQRVLLPDFSRDEAQELNGMTLSSEEFLEIVETYKPDVVVIDPLQSFIPADTNMSARNEIRKQLQPLETLAHRYGTNFIIVCHTNKKENAIGRGRMGDSADIYDCCRCVIGIGAIDREEKYCKSYASIEKSNYASYPPSALFEITDEGVTFAGTTYKHERDFISESKAKVGRPPDQKEQAKSAILDMLHTMQNDKVYGHYVIDYIREQYDISEATINRARDELAKEGKICFEKEPVYQGKTQWSLKQK